MLILGLDPGKSTGWGMIKVDDKKITIDDFGVTTDMTMVDIRSQFERADRIVYEGWWTRPKNAKAGSFDWDKMTAPQAIGSIETMCAILGKKPEKPQQPANKVPGYSFLGMKYQQGKKNMHAFDALSHAVWFAVVRLSARPPGLSE